MKLKILVGFLIVGGCIPFSDAAAQCPSSIPNLQSYGAGAYYFKKVGDGCLPFTVSVKNSMIGITNVRTIFDYKGGPLLPQQLSTDTVHTYSRPGVYTIVQLSELNGRTLIACPTAYVSDTVAPLVRLIPCGTTRVSVLFDTPQVYNYDTYWISWDDGNIEEVLPHQKSVSHTYFEVENHKIVVWGMKKPGYCKSQQTVLLHTPDQSTQRPVPGISAFAMKQPDQGELTIQNPLGAELGLYRREGTGSWESTGQYYYKKNEIAQILIDSLQATCFRVQASDTCLAEFYLSSPFCTASITIQGEEGTNALSWAVNELGTSTKVELWKDGKVWQDLTSAGTTGRTLDQNLTCGVRHCYQLVITNPMGRFTSTSRCRLTPYNQCGINSPLYIPDAFSPNNDGTNDRFEVRGAILDNYEISIFNSWGTAVFHSLDPQTSWDGTFENTPLPTGHYVYKITVDNPATGQRMNRTGTVVLLR